MLRFCFSALFALIAAQQAAATAQQVELLNFTSDSCPACRQMEPLLRDLAAQGSPVRRVDVNRERALASQFHIQYLPTFVAVADGQEVERHVGPTSPDHLRQMLQQAAAAALPQEAPTNAQTPAPMAIEHPAPPVQSASARATRGAVSDADLLAYSVRLRVEDPQGISYGTGTLIHAQNGEAIVLTCGHLFRESQGKLPVQVELFAPDGQAPRVADVVQGEVIHYDLVRDLGFVRIRPNGPIRATSVADRATTLAPGAKAISVGCNHGQEPTVWHTRLTAINRYVGPANVEASGIPVQGRSGGGLFNEQGDLIGVCFAADEEGNEGLYVGLPAIYEELDRLSLSTGPAATLAAAPAAGATSPMRLAEAVGNSRQPVIPAQAVSQAPAAAAPASLTTNQIPQVAGPLVPVAADAPAAHLLASGKQLTDGERATLEEIAQRSGGGEVIVIIRPQSPGDRCEILSLENPSQEFLNQLSAMGSQATRPRFTAHKGTSPSPTNPAPRSARSEQPSPRPHGDEGWSPLP